MTNITNTFNTLDSALEGAKKAGNDIFSGYENEIRHLRSAVEALRINKWVLTNTGSLLMIVECHGERLLSEVTVLTSVSAGDLTLAVIDDNEITTYPETLICKSDTKNRQEASKWYYLIDQKLASQLAA